MKRVCLFIVLIGVASGSFLYGQSTKLYYNQENLRERVKISLKYITPTVFERKGIDDASFYVQNRNDGINSSKMCEQDYNICFGISDDDSKERYAFMYKKWDGNYLMQAKLSTYFPEVGKCEIFAELNKVASGFSRAIRFVYLYDNENKEMKPVNLLTGSFTIDVTPDMLKTILNDRFYIKVYAVDIMKEGVNLNWSDRASWESGAVPKSSDEGLHVLIPEGAAVNIQSTDNITVGRLTNYGQLTNQGNLTILEGVEIIP